MKNLALLASYGLRIWEYDIYISCPPVPPSKHRSELGRTKQLTSIQARSSNDVTIHLQVCEPTEIAIAISSQLLDLFCNPLPLLWIHRNCHIQPCPPLMFELIPKFVQPHLLCFLCTLHKIKLRHQHHAQVLTNL